MRKMPLLGAERKRGHHGRMQTLPSAGGHGPRRRRCAEHGELGMASYARRCMVRRVDRPEVPHATSRRGLSVRAEVPHLTAANSESTKQISGEREQKPGEQRLEAELIRQLGELTLLAGGEQAAANAEALFQQAMSARESARRRVMGASRGGVAGETLARCKSAQMRRALLAPVLGRFTGGLDTPHLTEARQLLSTLS